MRLRLPELLAQHDMTAYQLAARSGGRISRSMAYRLRANGGDFTCLSADALDALCDLFEAEPGDLFTRKPLPPKACRKP